MESIFGQGSCEYKLRSFLATPLNNPSIYKTYITMIDKSKHEQMSNVMLLCTRVRQNHNFTFLKAPQRSELSSKLQGASSAQSCGCPLHPELCLEQYALSPATA